MTLHFPPSKIKKKPNKMKKNNQTNKNRKAKTKINKKTKHPPPKKKN